MIRVRPYRKNDASVIVNWCKDEDTFYKWSAGILGEYPITVARMENATNGRIDNDHYFPFVAVDEGKVVGFFTLRIPNENENEMRFGFVIVDPLLRGRGYGKKMLQSGLKFATEVYGAEKISLGVFDNNPGAYYCYKSVGFVETGETEMYPVRNEEWNCIVMEFIPDKRQSGN